MGKGSDTDRWIDEHVAGLNRAAKQRRSYAIGLRVTEEMRDSLRRAADSSGRSVAGEIVARLNLLAAQEDVFGGREARQMMLSIVAAYQVAGQVATTSLDRPEWREMSEWVKDPDVTLAAMKGAVLGWWDAFPDAQVGFDVKYAWVQDLYRALVSREANKDPGGLARVRAVEAAAAGRNR